MSGKWRPDDSLLDRNAKGATKGAQRVRAALTSSGIRSTNRITTSRDKGMAAAQRSLKRTGMPTGVQQWQLPISHPIDGLLVFKSELKARTVVPEHAHDVWVFRVIIEGSVKSNGVTLKAGDWMLVPPGQTYSITAGPTKCVILYAHCKVNPPPAPGPTPGPTR